MCPPVATMNEDKRQQTDSESKGFSNRIIIVLVSLCALVIIAELASVVALAFKVADDSGSSGSAGGETPAMPRIVVNGFDREDNQNMIPTAKPPSGENRCRSKKPDLPNVECVVDAIANVGPQAGANVTKGYNGDLEVDQAPITTPFWKNGMCPVNVHWHLGTEHLSVGEYDENGTGPSEAYVAGNVRKGYQCNLYKENDIKFTKPYNWKHCVNMQVGQTYEIHWPHSAAGACGTTNQYQTPFYDGVFCTDGVLNNTAEQIGVHAQVFTVVNDEAFYYPELMRGMIVDGALGSDIAMYTGSTTGTSRNNEICSQYSPITWHVDRQCHLISASSFDKMCADMKAQRDDMTNDLYPHGSRELVADQLAADNHQRHLRRGA